MRKYEDNLCECPRWMNCIHYHEGACGLKGMKEEVEDKQ